MGTTSSTPARPRAPAGGAPPQGFARAPANNGQLYGGFVQPQPHAPAGFRQPQFFGQPPREPAPPPAPAEQTTRTTTIRNHVNLKKSTLEVVPASPDRPNLLTVKFTFDANVDCWASVFPVATEHPKEGCRLTTEGEGRAPPARSAHPRGLGQRFESAAPIDVAAFDEKTLTESGANQFPLVIRLECITGEPKPQEAEASEPAAAAAAAGSEGTRSNANTTNPFGPPPPSGERDPLDASDVSLDDATDRAGGKKEKTSAVALPEPAGASLAEWVQSQTTYATLVKKDDGSWGATVLKQKIWVDGTSYELQEIFGIENCSAGVPLSEQGEGGDEGGESGKECVVCLSENRDTTVLPCRHMCMCSGCARMLRHQSNRCPICRTPVESLLEIKAIASSTAVRPQFAGAKKSFAAKKAVAVKRDVRVKADWSIGSPENTIVCVNTAACLFAGRFGLAPTVNKNYGGSDSYKMTEAERPRVQSRDPAGFTIVDVAAWGSLAHIISAGEILGQKAAGFF